MAKKPPSDDDKKKRLRRSTKRRRNDYYFVRCDRDEFNAIAAKAAKSGLQGAAYLRAAGLGDAGPRARRRPIVEKQLLARALGLHGKLGNNFNQIAHRGNAGNPVNYPALDQALKDWAEIRDLLYRALGKDTDPEP